MREIEEKTFDEERALYGSEDVLVRRCRFDGPADGESALKESRRIAAEECRFNLRYPLWHTKGLLMRGCEMTENCRAALWYSEDLRIEHTAMRGIKALRECRGVQLENCAISSPEFGWSSTDVKMTDCTAESEYFFLRGKNLCFRRLQFGGKYSFQYVENALIEDSTLQTKDAFWHCKNVTVRGCTLRGEYLAWYSQNLTLENCTVIGTQPFCYCKNLRLTGCRMLETDLAFEKSSVRAEIETPILSIKNPRRGVIRVPAVGEIIRDDAAARGKIVLTGTGA